MATHFDDALALFEIDGMPCAIAAQDVALKKAPVSVLACCPISPGKAILIITGDIASVESSTAEILELAGSRRLDHLYLPGIHPEVVAALRGQRLGGTGESLAIIETASVAAALESADAARKGAEVKIGRLHPASGYGGRGYFTLWGMLPDLQAAMECAIEVAGVRLLDDMIIAAPHDELGQSIFKRPWPLDPADEINCILP
ncbi:MAG: BMC domain-containing protein [Myxococcota bacterium]